MLPILSIITGPVGKIAGIVFIVAGLGIAAKVAIDDHDSRVRSELIASQDAVRMAATAKQDAKIEVAIGAVKDAAAVRVAAFQPIERIIYSAPVTKACLASPAIHAVVDGLRRKDP